MKAINIIKNELFGESSSSGLKLIYNISARIKNNEEQPPQENQIPLNNVAVSPKPSPDTETIQQPPTNESVVYEDENSDYIINTRGELVVPKEEAQNIQTLEDILDYLSDKTDQSNRKILDDVILQVIRISSGVSDGSQALGEVIKKDDKLLVDINYGISLDDSIGFKINKLSGSDSLTISLKKDGKILSGKFDSQLFNRFVVEVYRNSLV